MSKSRIPRIAIVGCGTVAEVRDSSPRSQQVQGFRYAQKVEIHCQILAFSRRKAQGDADRDKQVERRAGKEFARLMDLLINDDLSSFKEYSFVIHGDLPLEGAVASEASGHHPAERERIL